MSQSRTRTDDHWSKLSRQELITLGRAMVIDRLEKLGCAVTPAGGKLEVKTPAGRSREVFVSTQRLGGYAFWTKRRFTPAANRFAAIVLLGEAKRPNVYLVPSTAWRNGPPPLTDRPNIGKRSEPEYGISLARSSLPALQRYAWTGSSGNEHFR